MSHGESILLIAVYDTQQAVAGVRPLAEPSLDAASDFAENIPAILSVAAKLERRHILERTAPGRAEVEEPGAKFGPKPRRTPNLQIAAPARVANGATQGHVARSYDVSQATISRLSA